MSSPQTWDVRARFVALNPPFQGRSFPIVLFPAVIGRGTECAVFLDNGSVSRQHAVVEEKAGGFRIRDLGSRNGIKLADQPIHEAALNAGDVVTVGDVQLRFEPASAGRPFSASESPAAAAAPAAARTLTGQDIVTLVQSAPATDLSAGAPMAEGAPESRPRVGLNLKMVGAIVAALALSLGAGAFLLRSSGGAAVRRAQWPAVMVKVGERKWVQISTVQYIQIGTDAWWAPMDLRGRDIREIVVGNSQRAAASSGGDDNGEGIAGVEKYDPGEILITGKSVGVTGLTITLDNGSVLTLRVIVRGRLEDPLEPLLYGRYSATERVAMAQQFLDNGIRVEKQQPYLALQEYQRARAVLTPLPDASKGELYHLQIVPRLAMAQRTVDDRWSALRGKVSVAVASNDLATAIDLLHEAVKLIPDPNDPRRQKAEGALRSLIRRQLEERQ
jgi:hypothetical protein